MSRCRTETIGNYKITQYYGDPDKIDPREDDVISNALNIIRSKLHQPGDKLDEPKLIGAYLSIKLAMAEREHFGVLWFDSCFKLISDDEIAAGTNNYVQIGAREIIRQCLKHNASAAVLYHNHPSQDPTPSGADREMTRQASVALDMVGCKLVDHIVIGGTEFHSFANHGEMPS